MAGKAAILAAKSGQFIPASAFFGLLSRQSCYNAGLSPAILESGLIKPVARLHGLALWLLFCLSGPAGAEVVADLYAARVPVADQSGTALVSASRTALAEVLVKVSGSAGVLENPVIEAALGEARSHVQQYAYSRDADGALSARFEFERAWVTGLIVEAGAPLWTANRPPVLAWLVVEQETGARQFVSGESDPELVAVLLAEFSRRGIPLRLPLFDLADTASLRPEDIWQFNSAALRSASARYNLQDIVAGRFATLSTGSVAGDWTFLQGVTQVERSVTADSRDDFVRGGVALVAEAMAARYAVAATPGEEQGLAMAVNGIDSYADYAAVVSWLESIELIEHANVEWIRGDTVQLRLQAQADAGQLAAIIELNKRLIPLSAGVPGDPSASALNYQWQN